MNNFVSKALSNPHTTAAAFVYGVCKIGLEILAVWWPTHKTQIDTTGKILEGFAVTYGLWMAGDAATPPKNNP